MVIPTFFEHIKDCVFKCKNKKSTSSEDSDNFRISCDRSPSSKSVKFRSKTNLHNEIQNGSLSSSSRSLTRSSITFKSDRELKKSVESKPHKCIHQANPECLDLSHLYLEDGSCLVCNALTIGSQEFEKSHSFRDVSKRSNESHAGTQPKDANHQAKKTEPKRTLSGELSKLTKIGWYWGKLNRFEAEEKLSNKVPGTFLIRDSSDTNYLLSLSFKIVEGVFHTRIEYQNGQFHFYLHPNKHYETVSSLVDDLILNSQTGIYYYVRSKKSKEEVRFTIKLDRPLSRFSELKSLKHLCRFTIRESIRFDQIKHLPLPDAIKVYLGGNHL